MDVSQQHPFLVGDWYVDPASGRVSHDGKTVKLEPRVMDVLVYLADRPGQVVTRVELEEHVWVGRVISYDALTSTVQKLRRAFADDARQPRIIETLSKKGYRLVAPVSLPEASLETAQFHENSALAPRRRNPWIRAATVTALDIALVTAGCTCATWTMENSSRHGQSGDLAQFHSRIAI